MPICKTTYKDIFEQFRAEHKRWRIREKTLSEFSRLIFEATLKVFGLEIENLTQEELVNLKAKTSRLAGLIKNKLLLPSIYGSGQDLYNRQPIFMSTEFVFEATFIPEDLIVMEKFKANFDNFEFEDVKPEIKNEPVIKQESIVSK